MLCLCYATLMSGGHHLHASCCTSKANSCFSAIWRHFLCSSESQAVWTSLQTRQEEHLCSRRVFPRSPPCRNRSALASLQRSWLAGSSSPTLTLKAPQLPVKQRQSLVWGRRGGAGQGGGQQRLKATFTPLEVARLLCYCTEMNTWRVGAAEGHGEEAADWGEGHDLTFLFYFS